MDPASIIGIVAAACQFADLAAKGAIKGAGLLKSLEDTPVKLAELLGTVETSKKNMVQLRGHLTHPTLMSFLPHSQLQSFRADIEKAYKAVEELELHLEPLVGYPSQDQRGIKRLWRAVVLLKREGEFNERFETIQRHNEQIYRRLSGLQLALSAKNLETSVMIETKVNENTSALTEIGKHVKELNDRKTDVGIDVNVHGSSLIGVQQTGYSPARTPVEFEMRIEPSTVRDEIRSELMLLMTGQHPYPSSFSVLLPILSRLSDEDKAGVARSLGMDRPQQPSDPRSTSNFAAAKPFFDQYPASGSPICGCKIDTSKGGREFRRGPFSFGFSYQSQKRHHTSCLHGNRNQNRHHASCSYNEGEAVKRTWKYQLCIQLLPLVNKTLHCAFSATMGEGGLELRFPLKVFPTVRRTSSAIFSLFDNFTERCAKLSFSSKYDNKRLFLTWKLEPSHPETNQPSHVHDFVWDIDRVREELRYMHRVLCNAHLLQIGSIRDTDESGYTVLHELIVLIIQLIPVYSHVSTEISDLLKLVSATSPLYSAEDAVRTTLPLFAQLLDTNEQPYLPFDSLLNLLSLEFDRSRAGELPTNVMFYDMEVDAEGFDFRGDQGVVEMHAFVHGRLIMDLIKVDALDWAQTVVKSHVRKRRELASLGRRHLSSFERKRLGLSDTEAALLDAHSREVYDLLRKKGIQVPFTLHPGWGGSIYCVLGTFADEQYGLPVNWTYLIPIQVPSVAKACDSFLLITVAQQLFDNGFTDIDNGFTSIDNDITGITGIDKTQLPNKGATPNFSPTVYGNEYDTLTYHSRSSRSLLARIARMCGTQPDSHWSLIRLLAQYVSGLSPPESADSCVCYCLSSNGCLPQHLHASLDHYPVNCNGHEHRGNALISWINSCFMTHDEKSLCFERAVRLELFDRLGLVHTCCQTLRNKDGPPKPEDVKRIREEDEELASHLELLMLAYRGSLLMFLRRRQHEDEEYSTEFDCGCNEYEGLGKRPSLWGSHNLDAHTTRLLAHWRHWWSVTDHVLADIYAITVDDVDNAYDEKSIGADCLEYPDMRRLMVDTRTGLNLKALGLGDLDYKEVIERKFIDELAYARENIHHVPGGDGNYWEKKHDEATFAPVYRTELLDELMERLRRAVSGQDEMWKREMERWTSSAWWYRW
ncbi:hypothetical protein QBC45DRAFT_450795 [Copromyces sp. CBS 386.78]|nr:hypothetical protein QBC45DRAFT_450795 [Copromyces sp. CBS 386.78]